MPTRKPKEAELIAGARAADAGSMAAIYDLYGASLFRLAARVLGSREDAEDVVHDLFVGLPELLRRYEHRDQLHPWLRAVVVRLSLGRLRRERRREQIGDANGSDAAGTAAPPPADPWGAVDLERALARLPEHDRLVFVLRQAEGLSHEEIARTLGITNGASRARYLRALRRLRALLEPGS